MITHSHHVITTSQLKLLRIHKTFTIYAHIEAYIYFNLWYALRAVGGQVQSLSDFGVLVYPPTSTLHMYPYRHRTTYPCYALSLRTRHRLAGGCNGATRQIGRSIRARLGPFPASRTFGDLNGYWTPTRDRAISLRA